MINVGQWGDGERIVAGTSTMCQKINLEIYRGCRWIFICWLWMFSTMLSGSVFRGQAPNLSQSMWILVALYLSFGFGPQIIKLLPPVILELLHVALFVILAYSYSDLLGIIISMACLPLLMLEELILRSNRWGIPVITVCYVVWILLSADNWQAFFLQSQAIFFICLLIGLAYATIYQHFLQTEDLHQKNLALKVANEQIERLTAERVQQEIARDLHDTLTQDIIGINMELTVMQLLAQKHDYEKLDVQLKKTQGMTTDAIKLARRMISHYRKQAADHPDISLNGELQRAINFFKNRYELTVAFSLNHDVKVAATAAYDIQRVLAEALMNVVKHGSTKTATVTAEVAGTQLTLKIINQSRHHQPLAKKNHYGIAGMQERAAKYNGQVTFQASQDHTITVTATFQIKEGAQWLAQSWLLMTIRLSVKD